MIFSAVGPEGKRGAASECTNMATPTAAATTAAPIPTASATIRNPLNRAGPTVWAGAAGAARSAAPILAVTEAGTSGAEAASVPNSASACRTRSSGTPDSPRIRQ